MNSSITIVTAFFDIGRGDWTSNKGFSPHLERTADTYIQYFENLSKLDNDMVIFTSSELKPKIEAIRNGKNTVVVALDINKKFQSIKKELHEFKKIMSSLANLKLAS